MTRTKRLRFVAPRQRSVVGVIVLASSRLVSDVFHILGHRYVWRVVEDRKVVGAFGIVCTDNSDRFTLAKPNLCAVFQALFGVRRPARAVSEEAAGRGLLPYGVKLTVFLAHQLETALGEGAPPGIFLSFPMICICSLMNMYKNQSTE